MCRHNVHLNASRSPQSGWHSWCGGHTVAQHRASRTDVQPRGYIRIGRTRATSSCVQPARGSSHPSKARSDITEAALHGDSATLDTSQTVPGAQDDIVRSIAIGVHMRVDLICDKASPSHEVA
eukprot:m.70877 g.70877  ORF g.70877 m.70877 type:complete len:123 (+) comp18560_c0_seq1:803-1171(+)